MSLLMLGLGLGSNPNPNPNQVGGMSFIMFFALKMAGMLRVSSEVEEAGMDISKHGGTAYEKEVTTGA